MNLANDKRRRGVKPHKPSFFRVFSSFSDGDDVTESRVIYSVNVGAIGGNDEGSPNTPFRTGTQGWKDITDSPEREVAENEDGDRARQVECFKRLMTECKRHCEHRTQVRSLKRRVGRP